MSNTIGIIGMIFLSVSWIFQILECSHKKNSKLNIMFGILYFIGAVLLAINSIQLNDWVFAILNGFIGIMSLVYIILFLNKKKKR
ncbi:MAG: hypothetical protein WC979_08570 [Candidatus Pacearchaeota archaeon]|jgi:lipid-A-disaccharide synthase-like uncharacterized protein